MHMKIALLKNYECYTPQKWNSVKTSIKIGDNSTSTIKISLIDIIKRISNFQFDINCRRQIKFNLGNWWIMHLHHIGLPPATNSHLIELVSGNYLNLNSRR